MKHCKINKLNITINYEKIFQDFSIVKFSTSENYIKYGALILDELNSLLKAKSIVFERGKSFYALFDKNTIDNIDLSKELEKIEEGETLSFKILNKNEIEEIAEHIISQLLINSISTPNHKKLTFNNLTGKLYLFSPAFLKISKRKDKEQIFKIVALELNISPDSSLQLNVRTFSSVLLSKQMDFSKKKFNEYPKYTFVHATGTLKRVLNSENITGENQYILKQTSRNGISEKNNIPFLSFKDLEEFGNSKIGILNSAIQSIEDKLSNYLSIEFAQIPVKDTVRYSNSFKISNFKENIFLLDLAQDEDSAEHLKNVQNELNNIIPKANIKITKKESQNGYNLKLIHNRSYYEKYEKEDPYRASSINQHFTIEDFKADSKATLKVLITESIIKNDIKNNQISIVDWEDYGFNNDWIFGNKIDEQFCFLTIKPNGNLRFENFEPNLFNQSEYDMLCEIFNENTNAEFIVKDEKGNINLIQRTSNFTIPNYDIIYNTLKNEATELNLTKTEAKKCVVETFEDFEKQNSITNKINTLDHWNKKSLLDCFENRTDKKRFTEKVVNETGEILKSYLRDKTRYEIIDSQLDIHLLEENGETLYYVGIKGEGIQQQISRASKIRGIKAYQDSKIIFDKLLPLMNVDFVKNGDLTVLPFPIKYLKEWKKY
jgi:hypothetical protein